MTTFLACFITYNPRLNLFIYLLFLFLSYNKIAPFYLCVRNKSLIIIKKNDIECFGKYRNMCTLTVNYKCKNSIGIKFKQSPVQSHTY